MRHNPRHDPTGWGNDMPPWLNGFVAVAAILILAWGLTNMFTAGTLQEVELPHVVRMAR